MQKNFAIKCCTSSTSQSPVMRLKQPATCFFKGQGEEEDTVHCPYLLIRPHDHHLTITWPSPDHHLTITWPSPDHTWPTWSQSMQVMCRNPIEPHATLRTPSNPMEVHGLPIQSHGINIHHRRPQTVGGKVLGGTGRLMILGRLVRCLKVSHVAQNRNRKGPKLMTNSWQTDWLSGCSWKHAWTCVNCWGKSPESSPSEGLAAKRRQHHAVQLVLELRRLFGYCALAI